MGLKKLSKRFKGKKLVSLILLLIMAASTLTGFALQALSWKERSESIVEIPKSNIITYELTPEQTNYLVRQGKTVIEYRYQLVCENCDLQRSSLEALTNEFSDQLFLQEVIDSSATKPRIEMLSFYGRRLLSDPPADDILDALCAIMANPPARCITRNI